VTLCLSVLASVVAVAAAIRSTWSPCGLSMLSTITPLSEGGRGHSYRSTAAWFILGSTMGGVTVGAVMALGTGGVDGLHPAPATLGGLAVAAALVAAASDSGIVGVRLPVHRRQVNERWLDHYRPWVYGAGFGWQIGNGVSTYITTGAVYLMIVLAALTTVPMVALVVGTAFGLVRGLAVLMTRHLGDPNALRSFHRRFTAAGPRVDRGVIAVEVAVAAVAAVAAGSARSLLVPAVAVGLVAVGLVVVVSARRVAGRPRRATGSAGAVDTPLARPVPTAAD